MKKIIKIVFLISSLLGVLGTINTVNADADYDSAVASAPSALTLDNIFQPGKGGTNNSSVVTLDENNKVVAEGSSTADKALVKLTDAAKQLGSEWSTDANTFDINKDSKTDMWMYFGNKYGSAGDGMAFVLQNDARDVSAISGDGQSLGVWGIDKTGSNITTASTAIKNAWALEFDTYVNKGNTPGTGFDNTSTVNGHNHLAYGYPSTQKTYNIEGSFFTKYYSSMNHQGVIQKTYLSDAKWHHVTLNYKSVSNTQGTMTYTIDDKDPATDAIITGQSQTATIDKSKFIVDGSTTHDPTKLRWGFTGATGVNYENNLIMFEQISNLVSATSVQKVTDITNDNKDVSNNGNVMSGDKLNFETTLTYKDGKQDWKRIKALLSVPTDVTMDKVGTITYKDGTKDTFDINAATNGVITKKLPKDLTATNDVATVSVTGTANTVKSDTQATSPISHFNGINALVESNAVNFMITAPKLNLGITGLTDQTVNLGESAEISVNIKTDRELNPNLSNAGVIKTQLDDVTLNDGYTVVLKKTGNNFTETIPASKLKTGTHKYTIIAEDTFGDTTTVSKTITVIDAGILKISSVTGALNFGQSDIPIPNIPTTYSPQEDLNVEIVASAPGAWSLTLTGTDVIGSDKSVLKNALVYKRNVTDVGTPLKGHTLYILSGSSSPKAISKTWDKDTGVLLSVKPSEVKSIAYHASVQWNLSSVPTK